MMPNDILGLGKVLPIDKLIDIVSKAVGRISKPYFDRKDVDTKAYGIKKLAEARAEEMKIISSAVKENFLLTGGIEYKDEKIAIASPKENTSIQKTDVNFLPNIENRTKERVAYQENKRQFNIESITAYAAEELKTEQEVTDEPLDEDWTTRFFRYAEDISNEEMQALWGKILAGEIKQPKTYSIRTLELVRNLTKDEATLFIKAANLAINAGNDYFIFKGNDKELSTKYGITYSMLSQLIEVGIIQPGDFVNYNMYKSERPIKTVFKSGKTVIVVNKSEDVFDISIPIHSFTKSGSELLRLIDTNPQMEYLNDFSKSIKRENVLVQYGKILEETEEHIRHTPLQDFPE